MKKSLPDRPATPNKQPLFLLKTNPADSAFSFTHALQLLQKMTLDFRFITSLQTLFLPVFVSSQVLFLVALSRSSRQIQ